MQFTTRQLLIEVALIACFVGVVRLMFAGTALEPIPFRVMAVVLLFAVSGAFIGGLFDQFLRGALVGVAVLIPAIPWLLVLSVLSIRRDF